MTTSTTPYGAGYPARIGLLGWLGLAVIAVLLGGVAEANAGQLPITRVEQMPNLPEPYELRDWKQVARDFDAFVFDFEKRGSHLPLVWRVETPTYAGPPTFGLKSYVGDDRQSGIIFDNITCLGAVLGASMVGIDKSRQAGVNWVELCQGYYHPEERLYLNNIDGDTGSTYWYELLPNLLFYQIYDRYPDTGQMKEHFRIVADRWHEALVALGGRTDPWTPPEFDHTAFDFDTLKPFDNGRWREADAPAGIAWLQYMAYVHTGDDKYLTGARWAFDWLERREKNPYYECLMPFGAYAAARANAELNCEYDLRKLLNWCFDGDNPRRWGVAAGRWGDYDCAGLASKVVEGEGYAFAMNTYLLVGNLVPVARYDDRFARAIGKWMLNVANAARFFYPNGLPPEHQTCHAWSKAHDPDACIAYEGLRENAFIAESVSGETTRSGACDDGDCGRLRYTDEKYQVLTETVQGDHDVLEHIWALPITRGVDHTLVVIGHVVDGGDADDGFRFSIADSPDGPFREVFTLNRSEDRAGWTRPKPAGDVLYVKIEDTDRTPGNARPDAFHADSVYVDTKLERKPYAMGDPLMRGWAKTDLGLYGSCFVGMLGAVVEPTNVDRILQLDLRATETFRPESFPTHLYYNPFGEAKTLRIDLGPSPCDLYDAVSNGFLAKGATGETDIAVPPDSAVVAVRCPAGGNITRDGRRTLCNGVVIDYNNGNP